MTYLSGAQQKLISAFQKHEMTLNVESDHVVVNNSKNCTKEKIREIVEKTGFCPLIFSSNGNFSFTITPYKFPTLYFTKNEICSLLENFSYIPPANSQHVEDVWFDVNLYRKDFTSALTKGLSDIISRYVKDKHHPVIEIGSGIGYTLPEKLLIKMIRTQPNSGECFLLSQTISDAIYQLNIEGLYNQLIMSEKKVPLFFGLNVFDTMKKDERKKNLSLISQLQKNGDHLIIMNDTNPDLVHMIEHLQARYPNHIILPYVPSTDEMVNLSLMVVPKEQSPFKFQPSATHITKMFGDVIIAKSQGSTLLMQIQLCQLQEKFKLPVRALEDLFIEQVKSDLEEVNYEVNVYYHSSYVTREPPEGVKNAKSDLVYKPTAGYGTARVWLLNDKNLLNGLARKGLQVPKEFDQIFIDELRKKKHKIYGTEILVIEAKKI